MFNKGWLMCDQELGLGKEGGIKCGSTEASSLLGRYKESLHDNSTLQKDVPLFILNITSDK